MKIAFLYAGQGSQRVGMGADFYEESPTYRKLIDEIGSAYKNLMHEGPEKVLSQTRNTQPCMALFAAGVTKMLFEKEIKPAYVSGLSLGEYSALYAAGVFDEKTVIDLVAFRGKAMEKAAEGIDCKMTAVLGSKREDVEEVCKELVDQGKGYVSIANYNCPGQYVICGESQAVEEAEKKVLEKSAKRCIPLKVSGPFHTKYMEPAGRALKKKFAEVTLKEMSIPVVFNVNGREIEESETIEELLEKQVQTSIFFEDCIRTLLAQGVDTVIEIGPGKVLSGFVKKISRQVRLLHIDTYEDYKNVIDNLEEIK